MYNLFGKIINLLSKEILNYTPQLFHIEKNNNDKTPKALGSSVLYFSEKNYYLITAKHVFKHQDELSKIIRQSNEHFFVEIPKKRSSFNDNKPIGTLPKLTGISGSGLWYISNFRNLNFKLIAIMIEWDNIGKKFTKGTKINIVSKAIECIEN